jgi:poly(3-hydroxybutyrate) depolymerase
MRLSFLLLCAALTPVLAAADPRADFLHLIDRPRVPLAPEAGAPAREGGLVRIDFSYQTEAGQRVPGILLEPAAAGGRRPVVIALHGTGGKKENELPLLRELAQLGFVAVAIDGRYHGARAPGGKGDYTAAILRAYRTGGEHPFFFDSVWDVMRLVDWLQARADVDPARIGLIGISKGGVETYLAAAADPRIAVAVPCISVESFRWADEHDSWHSRIGTIQPAFDQAARDAGVAHPDAAFVHAFYARVAPGIDGEFDGPAMVPLIAPRPLLAINGDSDPRTPRPGLDETLAIIGSAYRDAGAPDRFAFLLQPHTGHKVTEAGYAQAKAWFVRWLKP